MMYRVGFLAMLSLAAVAAEQPGVQTGLDVIEQYRHLFEHQRVGIITNHTAHDRDGRFIVDIVSAMDDVSLTALFGPEHGFRGTAQAGERIKDEKTSDIPVYSLYGEHLKPTAEMLEEIDVLLFDIQDIGARFYTYIYTMAYAMEAAAESGKRFVVLDRPNPINGLSVQGNMLDMRFASFVGRFPMVTRHGMTIGELARMFNGEKWLKNGIQADLVVIPMKHYQRAHWYDQTGLCFIPPSPNMNSLDAAAVYPGTCLFEGTNCSEGRGTDKPFLKIGAPWIDAEQLAAELNEIQLSGLLFEPVQFVPTHSKYADQTCFGVRIVITDRDKIDTFWAGIMMVRTIYQAHPESFQWRASHFDRLCGTDQIRKAIIENKTPEELNKIATSRIEKFSLKRQKYLIY